MGLRPQEIVPEQEKTAQYMSCESSEVAKDLPREALGDVLRPSMLGPSSGSAEEKRQRQFGPELN